MNTSFLPQPELDCPTHQLGGQSFSREEIEFYILHALELRICHKCEHWFRSQLAMKGAKKNDRD